MTVYGNATQGRVFKPFQFASLIAFKNSFDLEFQARGRQVGLWVWEGVALVPDPIPIPRQSGAKTAQICATEIDGADLSRPIGAAAI